MLKKVYILNKNEIGNVYKIIISDNWYICGN